MPTFDPLDDAREALAKAELDGESYFEAKRRAKTAEEAELVAPLAERTGALPERLSTLAYLTPEDQQLYARDIDGSFVLRYVRVTDQASVLAHTSKLGKGINVLGEDETPASIRARQMKQQEMMNKVNAILARDAREKAQKELDALEARQAKEREAYTRERERHLANMRAVEHIPIR